MKEVKSKLPEALRLAKNKYNKETYRQPPVSIRKDLLADFAAACETLEVSQASVLKSAMMDKIAEADKLKAKQENSIVED